MPVPVLPSQLHRQVSNAEAVDDCFMQGWVVPGQARMLMQTVSTRLLAVACEPTWLQTYLHARLQPAYGLAHRQRLPAGTTQRW